MFLQLSVSVPSARRHALEVLHARHWSMDASVIVLCGAKCLAGSLWQNIDVPTKSNNVNGTQKNIKY